MQESYDARNLACARLIVASREKYSGPGSGCLITWAERVLQTAWRRQRKGSGMNRKAKGNRAESRSMKILEQAGYSCTRSAASLGVFDVVAISSTDIILLQVKCNAAPGAVEQEAIRNFRAPALCRQLIHVWKDRAREPLIKEL